MDGQRIADIFAGHYATIGSRLATKITPSTTSIVDYLTRIPRLLNSMTLDPVTTDEVLNEINKLPSKNSSGCENISNVLLKSLAPSISFPLHIICSHASYAYRCLPKKKNERS